MPALTVYAFLNRLAWPSSYVGRLLLIAFAGTHVPLIGLLLYVAITQMTWAAAVPFLSVALGTTLLGTALTLWALHRMLAPVLHTTAALDRYAADRTRPTLPTSYTDEAGRLMRHAQHTLTHLDDLLTFKNRMLGVIAHDARTPASSVRMASDVLADTLDQPAPDTDVVRTMTDVIRSSIDHQLRLMHTLLASARSSAMQLDAQITPCALDALISDLLQTARLHARQKNLRIVDDTATVRSLTVHTDADKLRQVLYNLISNAIKFTPAGGTVTLHASNQDDRLIFAVQDTGVGIDAAADNALFEPFAAHRRRGTDNESGSGLGLWICKTLTELLGGSIDVTSTPNEGSTFRVAIPHAPSQTHAQPVLSATVSNPNSKARS